MGAARLRAALAAGEQVRVCYTAPHDSNIGGTDPGSVPDTHLHLVVLYAVWLAWQERAAAEGANPDTTSVLLGQYGAQVQRAEQAYRGALGRALAAQAAGSRSARWTFDGQDPIY